MKIIQPNKVIKSFAFTVFLLVLSLNSFAQLIDPNLSDFSIPPKTVLAGTFTITPPVTLSTGLISYTSSNPNVATVSGSTISVISQGTTLITASQAADNNYFSSTISSLLTVTSVTVLTSNGRFSPNLPNYIGPNGAIGGEGSVDKYGSIVIIKITPSSTVFIAPGVSKVFLAHNLGADTNLDPHTPVQGIHGNYYQWGRSIVVADDTTPVGAIAGWNSSPAANGAWVDGSKTDNDPCPSGFRVPTNAQWAGVRANNIVSRTGTWANNATNFGSAIHWGPDASTKSLTLPAAGFRSFSNGALNYRGDFGYYWSSTENGTYAYSLTFTSSYANPYYLKRTYGFSVRCVSE